MKTTSKPKLKVIVGKFVSEPDCYKQLESFDPKNIILKLSVEQATDGHWMLAIVFCCHYDAAEIVLTAKSTAEVKAICQDNGVKITEAIFKNVPVTREDIEKQIEKGHITSTFIRCNLDLLFNNNTYRKQCFKAHRISYFKTAWRTGQLSKDRLIKKLLSECDRAYNYANEIYFLIA